MINGYQYIPHYRRVGLNRMGGSSAGYLNKYPISHSHNYTEKNILKHMFRYTSTSIIKSNKYPSVIESRISLHQAGLHLLSRHVSVMNGFA